MDETVEVAQFKSGLAAASHVSEDEADFQLYWGLARRFVPTLYRLQGSTRPIPCVEDIAVPPAALPVFLRHLQDTLKRLQVTASLFGHAGHGQLHIRPFLDLSNPDDVGTMESLASELYEQVWLLGGTISGEHGDGLSRTPFLARQYGPLVNVFRELKQIFDPHGIAEPGQDRVGGPDADDARPATDREPSGRSRDRRGIARRQRPAGGACRACSFVGSRKKWPPPPAPATAAALAARRRPTCGCARSSIYRRAKKPRRAQRPTSSAACCPAHFPR